MLILGQKGKILTKKGPKWAGLDFFQTVNINFPKEDHKNNLYTKNHQNSMNRFGGRWGSLAVVKAIHL